MFAVCNAVCAAVCVPGVHINGRRARMRVKSSPSRRWTLKRAKLIKGDGGGAVSDDPSPLTRGGGFFVGGEGSERGGGGIVTLGN